MGLFGSTWLIEAWKKVREDKVEYYRVLAAVLPMARTPMDRKGASALKKYQKQIDKSLDAMVPWLRASNRLGGLRGKVKPGEAVVMLDGSDVMDQDLYKDAHIVKG